ncbi:MAG: hypothetical protein MUF36_01140 [Bacteroidales bacterium]|nr:hypothetical protein [Bacteroidales bacterium]
MKHLWLILVLFPVLASSQEVKVRRIEKLTGSEKGELTLSGISPDGKYILVSSADFIGLRILDLKKKTITEIASDPGSGYEPVFSPDGRKIFFRSDEYRNYRKYSSMIEYDLSTGKTKPIEPPSRVLVSPAVSGDIISYVVEGKRKAIDMETSDIAKGDNGTFLLLEDLVPVLYSDGKRKEVKPNGEGNYIWASLSPDRTKILYNYRGTCTFISDTAGNILQETGRLNAPKWINDNLIAGMNDEDDGTRILRSDIMCYSMKTKMLYNLTRTEDVAEMYPYPFAGKNRIACQTLNGELYLIYFRIK